MYGWLHSWLLTIFTNCSSVHFVFRYSAILIVSEFYVVSVCNRSLLSSFFFTYSLSVSAFGWCILYIVNIFPVFLPIFRISSNRQLMIPKLYHNTGKANVIVVILFLAFNSDFSIILNILVNSFFSISFNCWCYMPSISSMPRYFYVFLVQALVFLCWSQILHFVSELIFRMDIVTESSNYLHICLERLIGFTYQLKIIHVK